MRWFAIAFIMSSVATAQTPTAQAPYRAGLFAPDGVIAKEAVAKTLADAGCRVTDLTSDSVCDAGLVSKDKLDVLVLLDPGHLPAASIDPISNYIKSGGNIMALGAPLWREPTIKVDGKWVTRDDYERQTATQLPEHVLAAFNESDIEAWVHAKGVDDKGAVYETVGEGPAPGARAMHVKLEDLRGWDNLGPASVDAPFPPGHTLTVFSARGGDLTSSLAMEWREKDGSRWIASVPLSPQWRRYVLSPEQFKYWESNPARAQDVFHPEDAVQFNIGLAFTHTGMTPGPQEYWVGPVGTAAPSEALAPLLTHPVVPSFDMLSPGYKLYEAKNAKTIYSTEVASWGLQNINMGKAQENYAPGSSFWPTIPRIEMPSDMWCPHPRAGAVGLETGREWRYIPILEARTAADAAVPVISSRGLGQRSDSYRSWCGNPAAMLVHAAGPYRGGRWVSFGIQDSAWYATPGGLATVTESMGLIKRGVYILEAGLDLSEYYTDGFVTCGALLVNLTSSDITIADQWAVCLHCGVVRGYSDAFDYPVSAKAGEVVRFSKSYRRTSPFERDCQCIASLGYRKLASDETLYVRKVNFLSPDKHFVTIENGRFMLEGKPWRPHGVNYMPSSGMATDDYKYFEQWMGARAYDPEIIARDLAHVKDLGLDAVSVFLYRESMEAGNLLDFLRQCEDLGIKVNLSLRPGDPFDWDFKPIREMIEYYRLAENDTVFAYDIAWEPMFWRHKDRKKWDGAWEAWIVERYGSVENAERDWQYAVPREDGKVTNPKREQLETDGDWRRMTAAYRRCMDTILYKYYSRARAMIKGIDPNHLVSFRMTEAGDPTMAWDDIMPFDFPYIAAAVDFLAPEGYGRIGDWEKIKPGWFQREYARWAAPDKPMLWAEAGVSAWDAGRGGCTEKALQFQGEYYRNFYRMMTASGADGIFWWWYPGGFRTNENSDYGIINPDGSDRPCTATIRVDGPALLAAPYKTVDTWIEIDRDARAEGVVGIYKTVGDQFWKLIEEGRTPGLRTAGTGTDSSTCPLLAVGNTPCNGSNPPKYLDGWFDTVEMQDAQGQWVGVESGATVTVAAGKPLVARIAATNLGEAAWRAEDPAAVYLTVSGGYEGRCPVPQTIPHFGVAKWETELVPADKVQPGPVVLSLLAEGRTPFGPKFVVTVIVNK